MRVITGTARGRKLEAPKGRSTRPTTDRVKESIFNIIQFDIEGRRVLDLFGGTGQLGLEALSRGAEHCTFTEQRREAAALIRENWASNVFPGAQKAVCLWKATPAPRRWWSVTLPLPVLKNAAV